MKPFDKITIVRNRHRARDLRIFRQRLETYFDQAAFDADGLPMDWQAARAARSGINQMLPRVLQVVRAAGLDTSTGNAAALEHIFNAQYGDGSEQEILDVIDMALGVYEQSRYAALARTVNPLHYVGVTLLFVAGLPGRLFRAIGFGRGEREVERGGLNMSRIEAAISRLAEAEESIDQRFTDLYERQAQQFADNAALLSEIAERLDFTERVLAQQRPAGRIQAPRDKDVVTPV